MDFPNDEMVLRYVFDRATVAEQIQVDTCMAQSDEFLKRVEGFAFLSANADALWASWSAEQHERVYQLWSRLNSLNQAIASKPAFAEKAQRFVEAMLKGTREMAVNLVLDAEKRLVSIAPVYLPQGYESQMLWTGVGESADAIREHRDRSHAFLSVGKIKEAVDELEEIAHIDRSAVQDASWQLVRDGAAKMEIQTSSRQRRISVKFWPEEGEAPPAGLFLMPLTETGVPLVATFEKVPQESYLLAEFEEVPTGPFKLFCNTSGS